METARAIISLVSGSSLPGFITVFNFIQVNKLFYDAFNTKFVSLSQCCRLCRAAIENRPLPLSVKFVDPSDDFLLMSFIQAKSILNRILSDKGLIMV